MKSLPGESGGTYRDRQHPQGSLPPRDRSVTATAILCVPGYSHEEKSPPKNPKFSRSSSNSALGGSCPAFVPSGIGAAERRCHRVLGKRDSRMGPMCVQGLWAGGTPGGLHRKRFPLGRDVLLARPAPARRWVPLAGLYPWIPFPSLSQLGISSLRTARQ